LSTIIISPDFDVILDAENKVVGEARSDVAVLDIAPLEKKVSELEALVDELTNFLSSKAITPALREEGLRLRTLFLKHMAIGFLIGLALFCLSVAMYHVLSHFVVVKSLTSLFKLFNFQQREG